MRLIKIDDKDKHIIRNSLIAQIDKLLSGNLAGDKTITLKYAIADLFKLNKPLKYAPPSLTFLPDAWIKLTALVEQTTTEVGVHGTVVRYEDPQGDVYAVQDIFVYPQLVSGATCTSADSYADWLNQLDDDTLNSLRFQAHSHVNMTTNPSAVDQQHRDNMLTQVTDYYIFLIINKRGETNCTIYDLAKGVIFEDKDIYRTVWLQDDTILNDWLEDAKAQLTTATYSAKKTASTPIPLGKWHNQIESW